MADEVLKDHFFQSLLQTDAPQELPASMREAGAELGGRLHAVALALPPARPEGIEARGQRVAEVCAPAQFRLLGDQHVMLIVSGDETAELMARTAAGARQLRMQLQEADVHTAIGIGGALCRGRRPAHLRAGGAARAGLRVLHRRDAAL